MFAMDLFQTIFNERLVMKLRDVCPIFLLNVHSLAHFIHMYSGRKPSLMDISFDFPF